MVEFGWSARSIVDVIKTADKIRKALRDEGGAKQEYTEAVTFLNHVEAVLKHLEKHIEGYPNSPYREDILNQLKSIEAPWRRLESVYMGKYKNNLGVDSTRSKAKQVPQKLQWALKDMSEVLRQAKIEILGPLHMIHTLLLSETMESVRLLNQKCQGILDDPHITNISKSLEIRSSELGERATTQEVAYSRQMESIASIPQSTARQQGVFTVLMEDAITAAASYSQEKEKVASILDMTKETVATVKALEEHLQAARLSGESLVVELRNEQSRLDSIQTDIQRLINDAEAKEITELAEVSVTNNYEIKVPSSSLGQTPMAAISGFVLGFSVKHATPTSPPLTMPTPLPLPTGRPSVGHSCGLIEAPSSGWKADASSSPASHPSTSRNQGNNAREEDSEWVREFSGQRMADQLEGYFDAEPSGSLVEQASPSTPEGKSEESEGVVWYCCTCKDGPKPIWLPACHSCAHYRDDCCVTEV